MPIINNKETQWNGYLIDNLPGVTEQFLLTFEEILKKRKLPAVESKPDTVNMWWRPGSLCLDVSSSLDGIVTCTVHVMDYGTSLFVGIAFSTTFLTDNYYKRMATVSFLETIDRCVYETINVVSTELSSEAPMITTIGKSGKFGG
jgi:hypothetical protein